MTIEDVESAVQAATNIAKIECKTTGQRKAGLFTDAAPEGTKCVFGVDPRDEGGYCIHDDPATHGANGWCWTKLDKSQWGSCNEACPLVGHDKVMLQSIKETGDALRALLPVLCKKLGKFCPKTPPPLPSLPRAPLPYVPLAFPTAIPCAPPCAVAAAVTAPLWGPVPICCAAGTPPPAAVPLYTAYPVTGPMWPPGGPPALLGAAPKQPCRPCNASEAAAEAPTITIADGPPEATELGKMFGTIVGQAGKTASALATAQNLTAAQAPPTMLPTPAAALDATPPTTPPLPPTAVLGAVGAAPAIRARPRAPAEGHAGVTGALESLVSEDLGDLLGDPPASQWH